MKKKGVFLLLISLTILSCNKHRDYIYSLNRDQCITIISERNIRYIIDGHHFFVPDTNYVKVRIKNGSLGDDIVGCWKNDKYKWKLINDRSIIIENKLDTSKFKFSNQYPLNNNIPTISEFSKESCFQFGYEYNVMNKYKRGIIVE